jgi:hypothetical protein
MISRRGWAAVAFVAWGDRWCQPVPKVGSVLDRAEFVRDGQGSPPVHARGGECDWPPASTMANPMRRK